MAFKLGNRYKPVKKKRTKWLIFPQHLFSYFTCRLQVLLQLLQDNVLFRCFVVIEILIKLFFWDRQPRLWCG